jgi:pilus assembly protein CpaF
MFGTKSRFNNLNKAVLPLEQQRNRPKNTAVVETTSIVPIVEPPRVPAERPKAYYDRKKEIFSMLIEAINVAHLSVMEPSEARNEVRSIVGDILTARKSAISTTEQEELVEDICNDVLGYGPLEPLLARDDIADIMVNGNKRIFIEVGGKMIETDIRFRDNTQLLNICQRIVSQVGGWMNQAPSAMPACPTAAALTSSPRPCP